METEQPQLARAIRRRAFRSHGNDGASLRLLALAEEADSIRFAAPTPDPNDEFAALSRDLALASLVELLELVQPGASMNAEGLAALLGAVLDAG